MSEYFDLFQKKAIEISVAQISQTSKITERLRPVLSEAIKSVVNLQIETANESSMAALRALPDALKKISEGLTEDVAKEVIELPEEVLPTIEAARPYMTEEQKDFLSPVSADITEKKRFWTFDRVIQILGALMSLYGIISSQVAQKNSDDKLQAIYEVKESSLDLEKKRLEIDERGLEVDKRGLEVQESILNAVNALGEKINIIIDAYDLKEQSENDKRLDP